MNGENSVRIALVGTGAMGRKYAEMLSSGKAARALLRRLIDREDKTCPLSDQKLCQAMAELGCPISRRTVAKYREEMNIAPKNLRKRF